MFKITKLSSRLIKIESPNAQYFRVAVNGHTVGNTRNYLASAAGDCGFSTIFFFPEQIVTGDLVRVEPQFSDAAYSFKEIRFIKTSGDTEAASLGAITLPDWVIDGISIDGAVATLHGWILPSSPITQIDLFANGVRVELEISPTGRDDLKNVFASVASATRPLDYRARVPVEPGCDFIEFQLSENGSVAWNRSLYYPVSRAKEPVPEGERITRVYGHPSVPAFLMNGATSYHRVARLLEKHHPLRRSKRLRLLDWGCGCAGVGRHVLHDARFEYHGIDIDFDNVEHSRRAFPDHASAFHVCGLHPPIDFPSVHFDAIFGISVVTHLSEETQLLWLQELQRLARPDGVIILSVIGLQCLAKNPALLERSDYSRNGFLFHTESHTIGKIVGSEYYYGTAYHSPDYIFSEWGKYFHILEYVPSGLSHQDLVVLRPRI